MNRAFLISQALAGQHYLKCPDITRTAKTISIYSVSFRQWDLDVDAMEGALPDPGSIDRFSHHFKAVTAAWCPPSKNVVNWKLGTWKESLA